MPDNFFNHECHKCGVIDEARFIIAGKHVKQICNNCNFYVRFIDQKLIPSVADIRIKIWGVAEGNTQLIEEAKKAVAYCEMPNPRGLYAQLIWWKVYLKIKGLAPTFAK